MLKKDMILVANKTWIEEDNLRQFAATNAINLWKFNDLDELLSYLEREKRDLVYIVIHQASFVDISDPDAVNILKQFLSRYYEIIHAKQPTTTCGILISPASDNQMLSSYFSTSHVIDMDIQEPIDYIILRKQLARYESYLYNTDPESIPSSLWPRE